MHDTTAGRTKFTYTFNGVNTNTIKFVFQIEEYAEAAQFANPQSLFTNIYNALPHHIKCDFAKDALLTIKAQKAKLTAEATPEEKKNAELYTVEDMQKFFITNWRPTITRGTIFRHLRAIRMRYNENPRDVVKRLAKGIDNAQKTIKLMNAGEPTNPIHEISKGDITELFIHAFATTNKVPKMKNMGGINESMQKATREQKPQHDVQKWYKIAGHIVAEVGGPYCAHDEQYELNYSPPQNITLWETPNLKTQPQLQPKRKPQFDPISRNGRLTPRPNQQSKRQKLNPQTPNYKQPRTPNHPSNQNIGQCFRCGRRNHKYQDCFATFDINGVATRMHERRDEKNMPFACKRKRYKKQSQTPRQPQPQRPQIRPPQRQPYPNVQLTQHQQRTPHPLQPNPNEPS